MSQNLMGETFIPFYPFARGKSSTRIPVSSTAPQGRRDQSLPSPLKDEEIHLSTPSPKERWTTFLLPRKRKGNTQFPVSSTASQGRRDLSLPSLPKDEEIHFSTLLQEEKCQSD
ncbi:hypothetical protein LR48_Vigan511s001700 [Vigna angularis]|uniref:Uncharacterized protein n=1 Tax=Phaseolus angularis TaxID=3914 RepID=A0A0L9TDE7_PHAAN|nr:hypothetical protein LR48_Vigan511s001700 [Vigna angularis]